MKTIHQRWIKATVFLSLCHTYVAFHTPHVSTSRTTKLHVTGVDPTDFLSFVSTGQSFPSEITAFLSTTLSTAIPVAHGHANPMFGPPDPYLAAGKSIAPSAKALVNLGITSTKTVNEMLPESPEALQQYLTAVIKKGWNVLDASTIKVLDTNHLPGFTDTRGIFGSRALPLESPESFAAEVKWAAGYFNVMNKLPFVAFYYALAEFFFLRPGVDMYKEEIEDDPEGVLADTISVSIVRFGVFALIAMLTVIFSG